MSTLWGWGVLLVVIAACNGDKATGPSTGTIVGEVIDAVSGRPIAGAFVVSVPASQSVTTDSLGRFTLTMLSPSTYSVRASKVGYRAASVDVVVVAGHSTSATIPLADSFVSNLPPGFPFNPTPGDSSIDVAGIVDFAWDCIDPDGDSLTYDVRLGTSASLMSVIGSGLTGPRHHIQGLSPDTTYYWQVTAHDPYGKYTVGRIWSFRTARENFAIAFSVGDRLSVPASPDLRLSSGSLTVEAWVRPLSSTGYAWVVAKGDSNSHNDYLLGITNNRFRFIANGPALPVTPSNDVSSDSAVRLGVWAHIAGVVDRARNEVVLYVNGRRAAYGPLTTSVILRDEVLYVGSRGAGDYIAGEIDDVRLWSRARTAAELAAEWNRRVSPSSPGLVADWTMDEGSGTATYDATPIRREARFQGHPTWVVSTAPIR